EVLAERAPAVRVTGLNAGLHAVLELPADGPDADELLRRALQSGLALTTMGWHLAPGASPAPGRHPGLWIGHGTPPGPAAQAAAGTPRRSVAEEPAAARGCGCATHGRRPRVAVGAIAPAQDVPPAA